METEPDRGPYAILCQGLSFTTLSLASILVDRLRKDVTGVSPGETGFQSEDCIWELTVEITDWYIVLKCHNLSDYEYIHHVDITIHDDETMGYYLETFNSNHETERFGLDITNPNLADVVYEKCKEAMLTEGTDEDDTDDIQQLLDTLHGV